MGNSNSFECVLEICANVCLISDTFLLCNFFYTNIQDPLKINNNITFNFILYFLGWLYTYDDPNYYQHFHDCLSHRFAFLKLSIFNWAVCSLLKTDNKQIKTNLYNSQSRRVIKGNCSNCSFSIMSHNGLFLTFWYYLKDGCF